MPWRHVDFAALKLERDNEERLHAAAHTQAPVAPLDTESNGGGLVTGAETDA
jgi:hypothetical protein